MNSTVYSFGSFLFFIYILKNSVSIETESNVLEYNFIGSDEVEVNLFLSGPKYNKPGNCLIKKLNEANDNYDDINSCPSTDLQHGYSKCLVFCTSRNIYLGFEIFSPRTRYVVVFDEVDVEAASKKTNDGTVFGLELRLLVNPQVEISEKESKLKLDVVTCNPVACPVYYKDVKYVDGTAGSSCKDKNSDNEMDLTLMIPHYEMRCLNYPSFFYQLQNKNIQFNQEVYKPQYYVTTKNKSNNKYLLKFTNKFPSEICLFHIKPESTKITSTSTNDYKSNCGANNKKCFAPCNNVELTFDASTSFVEILIQFRHFILEKFSDRYVGFIQKKYVVIETDEENGTGMLLTKYTHDGVTLKVPLFNPKTGPKFESCTVEYFVADILNVRSIEVPKCEGTAACDTDCQTDLTITGLPSGKPIMLMIAAKDNADTFAYNSRPANFSEFIFFRTENAPGLTFSTEAPTINGSKASIKVISGEGVITKDDITCTYYISPQGKDVYTEAICEQNNPCKSYCRKTQTFVGLSPETQYDLKVVAHKDYGSKVYSFTTKKLTLELTLATISNGFKVTAILSTPNPDAICHYKLKVKKGDNYELVEQCPRPSMISNYKKSGILIERGSIVSNTLLTCSQAPLCNDITITQGYEANNEYQFLVTAVGLSEETTIIIPRKTTGPSPGPTPGKPTGVSPPPTNPNKNIKINFKRVGTTLTISPTLTSAVDDQAKCKWELRNNDDSAKPIVKSCTGAGKGCTVLPFCKEITISDVDNSKNYHLTVIHASDPTIFGTALIKKGKTSSGKSTSKTTIIIAVVVPLVIILAGVAFYFGYWARRN